MIVTVVGQGYVGLPLAIAAAKAGITVFGFDNDHDRISLLAAGKSIIEDLSDETIKKIIETNRLGTIYCTRAIIPSMIKSKNGRI